MGFFGTKKGYKRVYTVSERTGLMTSEVLLGKYPIFVKHEDALEYVEKLRLKGIDANVSFPFDITSNTFKEWKDKGLVIEKKDEQVENP